MAGRPDRSLLKSMKAELEELHAFYRTRGGLLARRLMAAQLRRFWPDVTGRTVVGIGFVGGLVERFPEARPAVSLLPASIAASGGMPVWQTLNESAAVRQRVAIVPDEDLPVADGAADHVLLVHSFETSFNLKRLLREVWRITADGGSVIAVVPNRRGFWCWSERTPFGQGRPYTMQQLKRTLRQHLFEPCDEGRALFMPPVGARFSLGLAMQVERAGRRLLPELSGLVMVEARKNVMAPTAIVPLSRKERRRRYLALPEVAMAARQRGDRPEDDRPTR